MLIPADDGGDMDESDDWIEIVVGILLALVLSWFSTAAWRRACSSVLPLTHSDPMTSWMICRRAVFGISLLSNNGWPLIGDTWLSFNQSSRAVRSNELPSLSSTGSNMISMVRGHIKLCGGGVLGCSCCWKCWCCSRWEMSSSLDMDDRVSSSATALMSVSSGGTRCSLVRFLLLLLLLLSTSFMAAIMLVRDRFWREMGA